MPRRRTYFRVLLILIPVAGLLLVIGATLNRRRHEQELAEFYTWQADRYADFAAIVKASEDKQRRIDPKFAQDPELAAYSAAITDHYVRETHTRFLYYDQLSKKYRRAATRPWEAVPEDPPEPRPTPLPPGLLLDPPPSSSDSIPQESSAKDHDR